MGEQTIHKKKNNRNAAEKGKSVKTINVPAESCGSPCCVVLPDALTTVGAVPQGVSLKMNGKCCVFVAYDVNAAL